jgi:phenylacetate-CoA ligase
VNVYNLDESNIREHFNYIEKFRPVYIRGYCSGVLEFASLMKDAGLSFKKAKIKVAIVTAEVLYPENRRLIESVFGCKVANEYGSADGGLFAYECENGNMHINEESVYLNVKDKSSAVVTELFNDSMPIINYMNDDQISISENYCDCGRTSRYLKELTGRFSGYILKSDGGRLNQGILIDIFTGLSSEFPNAIRKFKVYQNFNNFTVQIVPLASYNISCEEAISIKFKTFIDAKCNVIIEKVDKIEREKSGKNVYFVNVNS